MGRKESWGIGEAERKEGSMLSSLTAKNQGKNELRVQDVLTDQESDENENYGDDGHHEDSACALCRRCQMRKRLEKKVAERNAAKGPDDGSGSAGYREPLARLKLPEKSKEDHRSIDELLTYINGYDEKEESNKSKKVKSRRKGGRRTQKETSSQASKVEMAVDKFDHRESSAHAERNLDRRVRTRDSSVGSRASSEGNLPNEALEDLTSVEGSPMHGEKDAISSNGSVACTSGGCVPCPTETNGSIACTSGGCHPCPTEAWISEIPPEVEEEIQREVEEFRQRLADMTASVARDKIKPMLIPMTMCNAATHRV